MSDRAIIVTGGKQYIVKVGESVYVNRLPNAEGETVVFDNVLIADKGENLKINPKNAKVEGRLLKNGKQKKIRIFKYNPKKGYRKRQGHRQLYSKVEITAVNA